MDKFSNFIEYREPTRLEHKKIVSFLEKHHFAEQVEKETHYFDEKKEKSIAFEEYEKKIIQAYLKEIYNSFCVEFRKIRKNIGYNEKSRSNVSRLTKVINFYLHDFCKEKNIDPVIQLFFYHQNSSGKVIRKFKCHLACGGVGKQGNNRRYSYNIVPFVDHEEGVSSSTKDAMGVSKTPSDSCSNGNIELYKPFLTTVGQKKRQNIFRYEYQWTKFVGRKKEMDRLFNFINYKANLLWWVITGRGGTGKSRLALELCQRLEKERGWHTGFLVDLDQWYNLKDWVPSKATLIVIDYSCRKAKKLGEFFGSLYRESIKWQHFVRILFIERNDRSDTIKQFCHCYPAVMEEISYEKIKEGNEKSSLELTAFEDEYIKQLIADIILKKTGYIPSDGDVAIVKKFIKEKIRNSNPLYITFAADAFTRNENFQQWDIDKLHQSVLEHNKKIWQESNIDENDLRCQKHINLLALSTMVNGVNIEDSYYDKSLSKKNNAVGILPTSQERSVQIYKILCDNDVQKLYLPLTPDILGEFFVLKKWETSYEQMKLLTEIAWEYKSWPVVEFMTRVAQDFPENKMIEKIAKSIKHDDRFYYEKSVLFYNLVNCYSRAKKIDLAEKYLNYIDELCVCYSHDSYVLLQLAKAGLCIIYDHHNISEAYGLFKRLYNSLYSYNTDEYIATHLARMGYFLVHDFGEKKQIDEAQNTFSYIYELWKLHSKDKYISLQMAKSIYCLVFDSLESGNTKITKQLKKLVNTLKDDYCNDTYISPLLAKSVELFKNN